MLRTVQRFRLPSIVLIVAPLLGLGGSARAEYDPAAFIGRPSVGSFLDGLPQGDPDDMGASAWTQEASFQEVNAPGDNAPALLPQPTAGPSAAADYGTSFGGQGSSSSDDLENGSGGQSPALTTRPPVDVTALIGVLFLQSASHMPPPFPSRLFRPPR